MPRLLLALALFCGCAHTESTPFDRDRSVVAGIEHDEQARDLGSGRLLDAAKDPSPRVRSRALVAIARLQRPETVDAVVSALSDPSPEVRKSAAFAAGQLGLSWQPLPAPEKEKLAQAVIAALAKTPSCLPAPASECERVSLARALGKLGQPSGVAPLLALLNDETPEVSRASGIALGLIAYATKGEAPGKEAIDPLSSVLLHGLPGPRYGAAYALMRMKRAEARASLTFGLKDADPDVRAVCARGLADVAEATELPYLQERLSDPSEGVRVEAARALGRLAAKCKDGPCPAADAIDPALELLAKAYAPDHPETGMALLALVQEKLPAATSGALDKAIAALAPGTDRSRTVVGCWLAATRDRLRTDATTPSLDACHPADDMIPWWAALRARTLADALAAPKARAEALLRLPLTTPAVAGSVDDGLGDLAVDTPEIRARIMLDLRSPDYVIALSAVDAAGKLNLTEAGPLLQRVLTLSEANAQDDGMATVLARMASLKVADAARVITRYVDDPRPTVRAGAVDALEVLKATTAGKRPLRPRFTPPDDGSFLVSDFRFHIRTSRGEIEVALDGRLRTARNFIELAERGFYDGLTWHRVVPDFVVQGGDPRGDGSGGPGYTIPCEISDQRYERGTLGMALSGKDTGGSQFFITLSPQPHLEGRYTIFGQVVKGMEVADSLVEGDRIESITGDVEHSAR